MNKLKKTVRVPGVVRSFTGFGINLLNGFGFKLSYEEGVLKVKSNGGVDESED